MPGNSGVENTQDRADGARAHENEKTTGPAHDVVQARAGEVSTVAITNQHGSNVVASTGPGQAHTHDNQGDGHGVSQARVDGNMVVLVENANGINAVVHTEGLPVEHINTMGHDGWAI